MAIVSDYERTRWGLVRHRNLAICGPEVLDIDTLQGLDQAASDRLLGLKAIIEAHIRTVFRDTPPFYSQFWDSGEHFANVQFVAPIVKAAYDLFEAIGREYVQAVPDPRQFEWLLDEVQQRVTNFAQNRLIEIATGRSIENWTHSPSPSGDEVNNFYLWRQCEDTRDAVWLTAGSHANHLKAESWERHAAAIKRSQDGDVDVTANSVEFPLEITPNGGAEDRRATIDSFLLHCNATAGLDVKIIRKHIWQDAGHTDPRQFQFWQADDPKATDADNANFRRILADPAGFVARFRAKHPD